MRTVTITKNVYSFDELSEEAQNRAIRENASTIASDADECDGDEYRACLEELETALHIKVKNWSVDECRYNYRFDISSYHWDELADEPRFLQRYLTDIEYKFSQPRMYYGPFKWEDGKSITKKRRSRVMTYCEYPITGYWTDEGPQKIWEERGESLKRKDTIREFIKNMLDAFFARWQEDIENHWSEDYIREELSVNDSEFLENGERFYGFC